MVRLCGATLGLLAFSLTVLRGLWVGAATETILERALTALLGFWLAGTALAWLASLVIHENLEARAKRLAEEFGELNETSDNTEPENAPAKVA